MGFGWGNLIAVIRGERLFHGLHGVLFVVAHGLEVEGGANGGA